MGTGATLTLGHGAAVTAAISGFAISDGIDAGAKVIAHVTLHD